MNKTIKFYYLLFTIIATLFLHFSIYGENTKDSLLYIVENAKTDTTRIHVWLALAEQELENPEQEGNFYKAMNYSTQALQLAHKKGLKREEALALMAVGRYHRKIQDFSAALSCYKKAATIFSSLHMFSEEGTCYELMIRILGSFDNKPEEQEYYINKILKLRELLIKSNTVNPIYYAYLNLGLKHRKAFNYDSSHHYFAAAIRLSEQYDTDFYHAYVYYIYNAIGKYNYFQAITFSKKLIQQAQRKNDPSSELWGWNTLGSIYTSLENRSSALDAFRRALQIAESQKTPADIKLTRFEVLLQEAFISDKDMRPQIIALYDSLRVERPCDMWMEELGTLHVLKKDYKKAVSFYDTLIKQAMECQDVFHLAQAKIRKADALLYLNQNLEATQLSREAYALTTEASDEKLLNEIEFVLSRAEATQGNFKLANQLYRKANQFKDSINVLKLESIELLTKEIEKEQVRIVMLEQENKLLLAARKQRRLLTGLIIVAYLAFIALTLFYFERRKILRKTSQLLHILNTQLDEINLKVLTASDQLTFNTVQQLTHRNAELQEFSRLFDNPGENMLRSKLRLLQSAVQDQQAFNLLLQEKARQQQEELQSFNYTISHDLKTPLNNAAYYLDLFKFQYKNSLDAQALDYLQQFQAMLQEMQEMIDGIAAYARAEHQELQKTKINLNEMVAKVLKTFKQKNIGEKVLVFEIEQLSTIEGDPLLIRQVFTNILSNAVKFSRYTTHPLIRIWQEEEGTFLKIRIQDNGIGFQPIAQPHLFQLFKSAHNRTQYPGTGIGLTIAKRIMERHNGSVQIESEGEGKGALATLFFEKP